MTTTQAGDVERALAALAVKQGVGIGLLADSERQRVLALAALALPRGERVTEARANEALKGWLAGPCRFLAVDHVELRRWLVDAGWWQRDDWGRAYERARVAPDEHLAQALEGLGNAAQWMAARRAAHESQRAQRRAAFEAGKARTHV
jgi:hypothetical protein